MLISACENEDIIKTPSQTEPSEPPLPVTEWYPAPKHRQQPAVYAPVQATQQQPVMASPVYQGNVIQQPWAIPAQQPMYYSAPQPAYPAQPPVNQYQPSVWAGQQPAATWPQPVVPQYQYVPRPWGNMTEPGSNRNSNGSTETWPQGGYVVAPWGGATAGQVPGTVYYTY